MLKTFIGLVFVLLSVFIAYKLSDKYSLRRKYFQEFSEFHSKLLSEVSFSKNSVIYILDNTSEGVFKKNASRLIKKNNDEKLPDYLTSAEKDFLKNYFYNVGKTDSSSQIKFLNSVNSKIAENLTKAEKDEKSYRKLYLKLGFLTGLALLIIII